MILVKNIIKLITEPFTYICNLSFSIGVFPEKMKIAKVIPLYKHGENNTEILIIPSVKSFEIL